MGMTPKEYDCITYFDLNLKIEGFSNRQKREESIHRMVGFSAYIGGLGNKTPFDKIWPSPFEEEDSKYMFEDKKEDFKELLDIVNKGNGKT